MTVAAHPRLYQLLMAVSIAASVPCVSLVCRGELVLHVDFENSSNLAQDVSGTGANGSIIQVVPTGLSPAGVLSQTSDAAIGSGAGLFNPTDSGTNGLAIEYTDAELPNLGADDNFAISYWVKPTTTYLNYDPNHAMFSTVATGADASLSFQIENKGDTSTGQIGVTRFSGPTFEAPVIDPLTSIIPGVWQNIAVVSNGQNGWVQIFVDGALTQDINTADFSTSTGLALNEVYLATNRGQNKLFQGLLDDVRVYDTAAVSELLSNTSSTIPRLVVDRDSGAASISIPASGSVEQITSYTITSANGVLDPAQWQPIASGSGSGSADLLSESFAVMNVIPGSPISLGDIWRRGPFEDLHATALLSDGTTTLTLPVAFEGNGGNAFPFGDIFEIGDGIDLDDWVQFKSGQGADLSSLSRIDAYVMGDLDGDGDNDGIDFALFEQAFDAANFPGALRAALSIPEPSSACLVGLIGIGLFVRRKRRFARLFMAACLMAITAPMANAQLLVYDGFDTSTLPASSDLDGTLGGQTSFGWDTNPWTDTVGQNNQPFATLSDGLANFPGLKSVGGYATRPARNKRTAISRGIGAAELTTLTAEGSEFWFSVIMANRDTPANDDEAVFLFAETPLVDFRDIDFANGFTSVGGQPIPVPPFRSIGIMFDDGNNDGNQIQTPQNPDVGFGDGDSIYAVYTDGSGGNAIYSDVFRIGNANEPHLIVGHVTWGAEGEDHQYDIYALGLEDIIDPLAPIQLPAQPFGSLTIPSTSVIPADLNNVSFAGAKLPAYDEVRFGLTAADVIPSIERLTLEVDISLGTVTLKNETAVSFDLDYLEIASESGSLIPSNWDSLSNNPLFPAGNNDGSGWEEGPNNNVNQLIESYLLGASTIAPNDEILLGDIFNLNGGRDLVLSYHLDSAGTSVDGGIVQYVGLLADFDGDGDVDADDLHDPIDGWEARYGVDLAGHNFLEWQQEFGTNAAKSSVLTVPEPASLALFGAILLTLANRRQISW